MRTLEVLDICEALTRSEIHGCLWQEHWGGAEGQKILLEERGIKTRRQADQHAKRPRGMIPLYDGTVFLQSLQF